MKLTIYTNEEGTKYVVYSYNFVAKLTNLEEFDIIIKRILIISFSYYLIWKKCI